MSTMMNCGAPSFCVLLLLLIAAAIFQTSEAVTCKRVKGPGDVMDKNTVECEKTCAMYSCLLALAPSQGCPSDFYTDCARYPKMVEFVKSNNPDMLAYHGGVVGINALSYVSGCTDESCLNLKFSTLMTYFVQQMSKQIILTEDNPIWYHETPGDADQKLSSDNSTDPAKPNEKANSGNSIGVNKLTAIIMATIGLILT